MDHEELHKVRYKLGEVREKGSELQAMYCPYCDGGRHKDKWTFSINRETGLYKCFRGTCGEEGNLYQLGKHLGSEIVGNKTEYFREYRKPRKIYKKPTVELGDISKQNIEYFKTRLISEETLIKNKVTTDKNNNIMFNYYLDGELEFIKYKIPRKAKKGEAKSWRETDTRPILYGMDECDTKLPLIIIEGEPDKLVLDECGIKNATSIPSGTEDDTWIDECWEWLEQFREIIIWSDNDVAGKGFQQEVLARLSDWKLSVVKCEYKDANVLLYETYKAKGIEVAKQTVRDYIDNATVIKKDFIVDLASVKRKDYSNQKAISTGYHEVDSLIGGMYGGMLVVWTGYTGSGKSTILSNMIINGIEEGNKTFVYSGELAKDEFKDWMDLQLSGKAYITSYDCPVKKQAIARPDAQYYEYLDNFYEGKVFLYDKEDMATDNSIIEAMEYMAKREGTKVFVIDNLMTMNVTEDGDANEKVGKLINRIKGFARTFNAVVHLVAHPKKPERGQFRVDKYSVSGTANIANLADRIIGFHRLTPEERAKPEYADYNNVLMIFKDRKFGIYDKEVLFKFEHFTKRFYTDVSERNREYLWVKHIKSKNIPKQFSLVVDESCPF